ncbi:MAG: M48 family metallopeptidase [Mollicutes bacterium PWAP]|nr:M48 family metallopeptidase [Mollicutes bacterium PWAP]
MSNLLMFRRKGKSIYVVVKYTNNKNIYLKYKENEIILETPTEVEEFILRNFVEKNLDKFLKLKENTNFEKHFDFNKKYIYIDGKKEFFTILNGFNKPKFIKKGNNYYFQTQNNTLEEFKSAYKSLFKKDLLKEMTLLSKNIATEMEIEDHVIKVSDKISNWGSNLVQKKQITYAIMLNHFSKDFKRYLAVHELTHNLYPNHSKKFWNKISLYVPNWKDIRDNLNKGKHCL